MKFKKTIFVALLALFGASQVRAMEEEPKLYLTKKHSTFQKGGSGKVTLYTFELTEKKEKATDEWARDKEKDAKLGKWLVEENMQYSPSLHWNTNSKEKKDKDFRTEGVGEIINGENKRNVFILIDKEKVSSWEERLTKNLSLEKGEKSEVFVAEPPNEECREVGPSFWQKNKKLLIISVACFTAALVASPFIVQACKNSMTQKIVKDGAGQVSLPSKSVDKPIGFFWRLWRLLKCKALTGKEKTARAFKKHGPRVLKKLRLYLCFPMSNKIK